MDVYFDNTLSSLELLKTYSKSSPMSLKMYLARNLGEMSFEMSYENLYTVLIPVLQEINSEAESNVIQSLIEQIITIARNLKPKEAGGVGYHHILYSLLPILAAHTTHTNSQIRQRSAELLVEISENIEFEDIQPHLLPIVKSLAKDATEEEHRVKAAQLLNDLAPYMKKTLCLDFSIIHLRTLSKDPMFRVRKSVSSNLNNICKVIGIEETTDKILSLFVGLANDEIWGVRSACAESLVTISENVTNEKRSKDLTNLFITLSEDPSRWVRASALKILGPFIATFEGNVVPQILIEYYCQLASYIDSQIDNNNPFHCAFSFPAVVKTVGIEGWPKLVSTFDNLVKSNQFSIRRSLSFSLFEIASILGKQFTETQLLPILLLFIHDIDDVKFGVVSHLSDFFSYLSMESRIKNIQILDEISHHDKWRLRKIIAFQLGSLSLLYPSQFVLSNIVPIFLDLINDDVSIVRQEVVKSFCQIYKALNSENPNSPNLNFIASVNNLAFQNDYHKRQLYTIICQNSHTFLDPSLFETHFLPNLILLSKDKVANVRIIVAKTIILLSNNYKSNPQIQSTIQSLLNDIDEDVVFFASKFFVQNSSEIKDEMKLDEKVDKKKVDEKVGKQVDEEQLDEKLEVKQVDENVEGKQVEDKQEDEKVEKQVDEKQVDEKQLDEKQLEEKNEKQEIT